jgi:neutral ceramidase
MMHLPPIHRLLCVLLVAALAGIVRADRPTWKAGLAKTDITPAKSMWLAGYGGRDRPSEGTLHRLWLKVLVLEAPDGHRGVVVTSDLLGFPRAMYERIVAELGRRGLERSQIMLTASHTHTGPVLRDALYDIYPLDAAQRAVIEDYSAGLEKTVVATVTQALASLQPVTLQAGEGSAAFAANRRNNREADVPAARESGTALKGPVDHGVPVLAVRSARGQLLAVVCSYACHATTLSFYQWSGDWPGFAQLALEARHPETQAMFYAGCGADQNPLPRRTVELCRQYGEELATAVDRVLAGLLRPVEPRLQTAFTFLDLEFDRPPTRDELQAIVPRGGYEGRWAKRLLAEAEQGTAFAKGHPYPIQVWTLGRDQLWIALGGEVVVDYALALKQKYGPTTWVAGYSNDVMAYIPSQRVWQEGGYESGAFAVYGLPTQRWKAGLEDRILQTVAKLVGR